MTRRWGWNGPTLAIGVLALLLLFEAVWTAIGMLRR